MIDPAAQLWLEPISIDSHSVHPTCGGIVAD